jgi:hypothetical protein
VGHRWAMMGGSPIGDDVSVQSSPAAKADEIYSKIDKTTTWLSSSSTQASSPVTCPSSYPQSDTILALAASFVSFFTSCKRGLEVGEPPGGGKEEDFASMAISGELGSELGEPPGSDEEDVVTIDISGEPGSELGESPPTWPPLFTSSSARSGGPFRPRRAVVTLP